MLLKIKAKIYQYTGIYLAEKEEQAYLRQVEAELLSGVNSKFLRNKKQIRKDEIGLAIGLWQANNGFVSFCSLKKNKVLARLEIIFKQLKRDLGF
jgi:hypothetical protein